MNIREILSCAIISAMLSASFMILTLSAIIKEDEINQIKCHHWAEQNYNVECK